MDLNQTTHDGDVSCFLKDIGRHFKSLRTKAALTQKQLAEASGLDLRNYQDLEGGKSNFRIGTLFRLATYYRIPIHTFFRSSVDDLLRLWLPPRLLLSEFVEPFRMACVPDRRASWDNLDFCISIVDRRGLYRYVNAKWQRTWGYAEGDVVDKLCPWDLFQEGECREWAKGQIDYIHAAKRWLRPILVNGRCLPGGSTLNVKIDWDYLKGTEDEILGTIAVTWSV